ncbi:hypothetical protein SALBM135S_07901 [Streptomyces alboniger]
MPAVCDRDLACWSAQANAVSFPRGCRDLSSAYAFAARSASFFRSGSGRAMYASVSESRRIGAYSPASSGRRPGSWAPAQSSTPSKTSAPSSG